MISGHGRRAMVGREIDGGANDDGANDGGAIDPSAAGAIDDGALGGVLIVRGGSVLGATYCGGVTRDGEAVTWTAYADCAGDALPVGDCGKLSSSEIF